LVKTDEDDNTWAEMTVLNLSPVKAPLHARFQLFVSGLAAKFTFLIDTETGTTWVLVTGKRKQADGTEYEVHSWQPFTK